MAMFGAGELTAARASAVLLDEYVGLVDGHPEAYRAFIRRELVDRLDLPVERLVGPDVGADDLPRACDRYDQLISDLGGVDVQPPASGVTATSASTSPAPRWRRARG